MLYLQCHNIYKLIIEGRVEVGGDHLHESQKKEVKKAFVRIYFIRYYRLLPIETRKEESCTTIFTTIKFVFYS